MAAGFVPPVTPSLPVLKISSMLVVPKENFAKWVSQHTQGGAE